MSKITINYEVIIRNLKNYDAQYKIWSSLSGTLLMMMVCQSSSTWPRLRLTFFASNILHSHIALNINIINRRSRFHLRRSYHPSQMTRWRQTFLLFSRWSTSWSWSSSTSTSGQISLLVGFTTLFIGSGQVWHKCMIVGDGGRGWISCNRLPYLVKFSIERID